MWLGMMAMVPSFSGMDFNRAGRKHREQKSGKTVLK